MSPAPNLRVMTYNIKRGAESSLDSIAGVIQAEDPDIVGLQEVDMDAARSGRVHQAWRLGDITGLSAVFLPSMPLGDGGLYGNALLSRFPILRAETHALPSLDEPRALLVAELEVPGLPGDVPLTVAVTHLGLDEDERARQVAAMVPLLVGIPWLVLMGDLNAASDIHSMHLLRQSTRDTWSLAGHGAGLTFPAAEPAVRIDYVLLGNDPQGSLPDPLDAHVSTTTASDHRPVVATVPLPAQPAP